MPRGQRRRPGFTVRRQAGPASRLLTQNSDTSTGFHPARFGGKGKALEVAQWRGKPEEEDDDAAEQTGRQASGQGQARSGAHGLLIRSGTGAPLGSALAGVFDAEMLLLHVLDVRLAAIAGLPPDMASMPAVDELVRSASAEAEQQMQALGVQFPDARTILNEGVPRLIILEVAKAEVADLIVMGTHGRTGLSHVFFGSVAERVVRHSRVPVLTARQEDVA